jgi:hypothetical protein
VARSSRSACACAATQGHEKVTGRRSSPVTIRFGARQYYLASAKRNRPASAQPEAPSEAAPASPAESAEQVYEKRITHDHLVRFHMALILAAVTASGVLASKCLLITGVHSLHFRYPVSVVTSYLVFLLLVRVWLWYISLRNAPDFNVSAFDLGDGGSGSGGSVSGSTGFSGFGGGDSGGGGASDSWGGSSTSAMLSQPAPVQAAPSVSSGSSWFPKLNFDFDVDGDGWWVLALLAALILAIFGAGVYLIYAAPHILPEAAWQVLLAGTLTRVSNQDREHHNWMAGVVRATWIPFVVVLVLATALGWEAHHVCPSAMRLADVFHCAVQ